MLPRVVSRKLTDISEVLTASIIRAMICGVWSIHDNAKIDHFEIRMSTDWFLDVHSFGQSLISVSHIELPPAELSISDCCRNEASTVILKMPSCKVVILQLCSGQIPQKCVNCKRYIKISVVNTQSSPKQSLNISYVFVIRLWAIYILKWI
jgi:hypothetical protein